VCLSWNKINNRLTKLIPSFESPCITRQAMYA